MSAARSPSCARPGTFKISDIATLFLIGHGIKGLDGKYITGEDVGSTVEDMIALKKITDHVMGTPVEQGSSEEAHVPWTLDDRVSGTYLSQPFTGKVVSAAMLKPGWFRLALQLDEAVDVVTSSHFTNLRTHRCTRFPSGSTTAWLIGKPVSFHTPSTVIL